MKYICAISHKSVWSIWIFVSLIVFSACSSSSRPPAMDEGAVNHRSLVNYAKGFDLIDEGGGMLRVKVYYPDQIENLLFSCYLSGSDKPLSKKKSEIVLPIPLDSVAVFSATQLNGLALLGMLDKVVGISEARFITNELMKQRLAEGSTIELGNNGAFFVERTLALQPQAIFFSPYQFNQAHPLAASQQLMIPFMDFMETDPLARAEWIKFTAAFMGKYPQADSLFQHIVMAYDSLKGLTQDLKFRPTVMSDKYFADQWYVPGGKSYIATMLNDAGGDYIWKNDDHVASVPLDVETVLNEAAHADFWRIVGHYDHPFTYDQLVSENELYAHFDAFKNRNVIFCDSRKTGYFERGSLEPHIQLADLIFALHPELLPGYHPVYYHLIP